MDEKKVMSVLDILGKEYPEAVPELKYNDAYELIVAVILSAQCTDKRVNQVTPALFGRFPDVQSLAKADVGEVETLIHSCGFFRNKAKNLVAMAQKVCADFGGKIPDDFDELQTLPGVGRKTANVVFAVAFSGDAIAVDTHVFRVSNRLGLATAPDVFKTEMQLRKTIPQELWSRTHHYLIYHGRRVCKSRKPDCANCKLAELCEYNIGGHNERNS